jgi:hypothetical protein
MTNHERILEAVKAYRGQTLLTCRIEELSVAQGTNRRSVRPNDHAHKDHKGHCTCADSANRIFDQVERGLYRVR